MAKSFSDQEKGEIFHSAKNEKNCVFDEGKTYKAIRDIESWWTEPNYNKALNRPPIIQSVKCLVNICKLTVI